MFRLVAVLFMAKTLTKLTLLARFAPRDWALNLMRKGYAEDRRKVRTRLCWLPRDKKLYRDSFM